MIHLAGAAFGLLLGAILGSFIATLCLRWPQGRSVLRGRSACDHCGTPVPTLRLVPLVSGTVSGGRAHCCGGRIDPLHLQIEWSAALLGAAALGVLPNLQGVALAAFGWLLLPLFFLDLRHFWLPNSLVAVLALSGVALGGALTAITLLERLATSLIAWSALALIAFAYRCIRRREGMGAGDPKLLAAIALWLGAAGTVATLLLAAILGLAEAIARRRAATDAQPLGTYLCLAAWIIAWPLALSAERGLTA